MGFSFTLLHIISCSEVPLLIFFLSSSIVTEIFTHPMMIQRFVHIFHSSLNVVDLKVEEVHKYYSYVLK